MKQTRIKTTGYLNELLIKYYNSGKKAEEEGKTVAYVSAGFPIELLYGIDILPFFPQNHAAFYSAQGKTNDLFDPAENEGLYTSDLCSEIKATIGIAIGGESLSFHIPKPDMIIAANNICGSITKGSEVLSKYYNVPLFVIDIPFVTSEITPHSIDYVCKQFKNLIIFLEKVTGRKYDYHKLEEVSRLSQQCIKLWREIVEMFMCIPTPINGLDFFVQMLPLTTLRGTEDAVKYYQRLKNEVKHRMKEQISAVPGEKFRLFWDYLPIYHKMKYFSRLFAKYKACFVACSFFFPEAEGEYLNDKGEFTKFLPQKIITEKIIHYIAYGYLTLYVNRSLEYKASMFKKLAGDYSINGFVLHVDRSCKPQSLPQYELKNILEEEGFPTLIIDADSMDPRFFSEGQVTTRVEAFIETLENRLMSQN